MNEEKLHNIEATIAHQDQQIQDLSEMVTKQWDEISAFKTQIVRMQGKLDDAVNASDDNKAISVSEMAAADKPPHY